MIDSKGSIVSVCVFLVFGFIIAGCETLPARNKENCTYAVTIETTCTKGAKTSNHVSLRFGDTKSNDILVNRIKSKHVRWVDPLEPQVLDDVPRKPFQACMVDQFQITDNQCVESPICYLYLKLSGDDDWRPGFVHVQVLDRPRFSSNYFYFRRYLPRKVWHGSDLCDREVTPFGIKYKRKVFVKNTDQTIF